ncbi:MAG TPA: glycosyltransferase family 2 protein [Thermoanaerobaculia bacterium]|nr:glycosyltransferase family 2 protein [Thermoanaerobaculia bacterium]
MPAAPRVSVLMPLYNDERFVAAAIDSILGQTFADFELLIVHDASTDRSRAIAASYPDPRIRLVDNDRNLGLTRSLNRGLALVRGEYVARLDADDVSFPARLAEQVAWLDAHPAVAALGVQAVPIDVRGRRIRRVPLWNAHWRRPAGGLWMDWYRIFDTPFVHSGVMFRRAIVEELGGYDERHPLEQDAELWMRLGRSWQLANLGEALVAFRFHRSSMTADPSRPERQGYAERRAAIVHATLRELLRWEEVPPRWAALWVAANDPSAKLPAADVRELADALDACAERFFTVYPEARRDRGIARHRASMVARLVDKSDARTAVSLYGRLLRLDPRTAALVLPRAAIRRVVHG